MRWGVLFLLCVISFPAISQESRFHAEARREGERVSEACDSFGLKLLTGCAYTLFTDHPFHIAAGSMPPQNGFGFGGAFVWEKNTPNWRMSWDIDAVGATSASWRAGGYMTLVHTPAATIHVGAPGSASASKSSKSALGVHPYTVFNFYAQSISLNKINYFGLGNDTTVAGASLYGMSETIVGGRVIKPVFEVAAIRKLNLSLLGELNGRFVSVRGEHGQSVPSIEQLYTNASAPGLSSQPGFIQAAQGIRIKPAFGFFHLNYAGRLEEFGAPSNSQYSFLRWSGDFNHLYYLHSRTQTFTNEGGAVGPDECGIPIGNCPPIPTTANVNGSISVRVLISESITSGTSVVPFYFQQTLGGQDINNALTLGSYQDYRFRAPNLLLFQQRFEHSIWGPFGFQLMADEGRVALTHGDLGFNDFRHSFGAGFTLRAGGFPMVYVVFAWGGSEGHHNIANMNTTLLGGGVRPSLN